MLRLVSTMKKALVLVILLQSLTIAFYLVKPSPMATKRVVPQNFVGPLRPDQARSNDPLYTTTVPGNFVGPLRPGQNRTPGQNIGPDGFVRDIYGNPIVDSPYTNQTLQDRSFQSISPFDQALSSGGAEYGTTGGTTGDVLEPNIQYLNGIAYDLNNPDQLLAFYGAQRDAYLAQVQQESSSALRQAAETYGTNTKSIDEDLFQIDRNQADYGRSAVRQVEDLGTGYDVGTENRRAYYGKLSPNAYQSSQGTGQQYAKTMLDRGISDVQNNLATATSEFDRNRTDLTSEKSRLGEEYNRYLSDQGTALQTATQSAEDFYNTQGATTFAPGGFAQYQGNRSSFTPYKAPTTDLSPYSQVTNFQAGPAAGGSTTTAYNPVSQPDLTSFESYLGYEPSSEERNLLQRYLMRGV